VRDGQGVPVFGCSGVPVIAALLLHCYIGIFAHLHIGPGRVREFSLEVCKCVNVQVRVCKCANLLVCWCAGVSLQVC
jgi:hypothetical protein